MSQQIQIFDNPTLAITEADQKILQKCISKLDRVGSTKEFCVLLAELMKIVGKNVVHLAITSGSLDVNALAGVLQLTAMSGRAINELSNIELSGVASEDETTFVSDKARDIVEQIKGLNRELGA